ncbi:hypothetical protein ACIBSV_35810 [Embleya sp. NPDC050154]|uniref:hypothetical protein n=1 Tax=unclassified Embleya TaxID=2699296 RepID=UPI00378AB7FA
MSYRVAYTPDAEVERAHLAPERRKRFDAGMTGMAADPYAHGSTLGGDRDRREATVAGVAFIRYVVSAAVVTVTVVKLVPAP